MKVTLLLFLKKKGVAVQILVEQDLHFRRQILFSEDKHVRLFVGTKQEQPSPFRHAFGHSRALALVRNEFIPPVPPIVYRNRVSLLHDILGVFRDDYVIVFVIQEKFFVACAVKKEKKKFLLDQNHKNL
jgi:hypothetical protein